MQKGRGAVMVFKDIHMDILAVMPDAREVTSGDVHTWLKKKYGNRYNRDSIAQSMSDMRDNGVLKSITLHRTSIYKRRNASDAPMKRHKRSTKGGKEPWSEDRLRDEWRRLRKTEDVE